MSRTSGGGERGDWHDGGRESWFYGGGVKENITKRGKKNFEGLKHI